MYLTHVDPRKSAKWVAPPPEELVTTDRLVSRQGALDQHDAERASGPADERAPTPSTEQDKEE